MYFVNYISGYSLFYNYILDYTAVRECVGDVGLFFYAGLTSFFSGFFYFENEKQTNGRKERL